MRPRDWQEVWAIFEQAVAKPAGARAAFVTAACAGDAELLRAVEDMLAADEEVDTILDEPLLSRPVVAGAVSGSLSRPMGEPAAAPASGSASFWIGAYRIEGQLGQGGMSTVYLASWSGDGHRRRVVVKVVRRGMERADILERLRIERRILAGLEHPNIARLYDGGATDEGLPFFVMEHVEGQPIDVFCAQRALSIGDRLALFRKVCAAVHYAHQNLVVHRDLKPSNILVTGSGEPKLLDFGIAKVLDADAWGIALEPTVTASRMLTPTYASPEQFRGGPLSTASDVYSLGVLLYQLLAGRLPYDFSGCSPLQVERMITGTEPLRPSAAVRAAAGAGEDAGRLARALEGDLDAIVLKALRSDPRERYGSAEQLGLELDRQARGLPVEARSGTLGYRARRFARRHRGAVAIAATSLVVLVGVAVALAVQASKIARERDQARLERDQKAAVIDLFEDLVASAEPLARQGSDLSVLQLLTGGSSILADRLEDQPLVRAQLLHTSGRMLRRLGHLAEARAQLEAALAVRRSVFGEHHADVAATLCQLGRVARLEGNLEAAESATRRCVGVLRQLSGADPAALADALSALGGVLWAQQRLDAAGEALREALDLARDSEPPRHSEVEAQSLQLLAQIEISAGDYAAAVGLLRAAVTRIEAIHGGRAPQREPYLNDLAIALRWTGDLAAAEAVYEEGREVILATYGARHSEYARILNNLAGLRFARADYAGAAAAYEEARAILLDTVGPDHWRVFFLDTNVQAARIRQGQAAAASAALAGGRARWLPKLGAEHWLLAQVDSLLGEAAAAEGRDAEAERLLTEGYRRLVAASAKHRYQLKAFERLSAFLEARGRGGEIAAWQAMMPVAEAPEPPG